MREHRSFEPAQLPRTERVALPPPRAPAQLPSPPVEELSSRELLAQVTQGAVALAKKEIELVREELRADLKAEVSMAKGLGVASVCALCTVNLMLVAVVLALGTVIPEWAAALAVAAVTLLAGTIFGLAGWRKRARNPLGATRRSLQDNLAWVKARLP